MTNTQSPAPGVAAEAIELLEALMPDMSDSNEAEAKRIVKVLRTALQASAATTESVPKEDYEGVMRMLAEQRAANARVAELIFQNDRVEAVKWAKGLTTDGVLCWVEAPPLPAQVQEAAEMGGLSEADKLRNGNTALLDALMGMVNQFFYADPDGVLRHSFMSAEEQAIGVLIEAGMAEEAEPGKNAYNLKWDALEARKPKQISWAEAVEQTITDPAEKARLLALGDEEVQP